MILCAGEALIDMLPRQSTSGENAFAPLAGGSVFNTAIALGRLDAHVQFFSGLSSDLFGDVLRAELTASKVDSSPASISDRPTTLAFVKLTNGHASYAFYDENTAGRLITANDLPEVTADAIFFGGISLVVEPCAAAYQALMLREAPTRVTMIDPNIRPGFIKDIARYRARLDHMLALADIVKVSDEDLNWINPAPLALRDKVADLLNNGPSVVILTRGSEGATGYLADGAEVQVPALKTEVVDTVGAGDTFNAGVLAKMSELGQLHKDALRRITPEVLAEALAYGAQVAAVTVSRAGANPPWIEEMRQGPQ